MPRARARSRVLTPLLVVLTSPHLVVVSVAAGADGADTAGRVFEEGFEGGLERWDGRGIELAQADRQRSERSGDIIRNRLWPRNLCLEGRLPA